MVGKAIPDERRIGLRTRQGSHGGCYILVAGKGVVLGIAVENLAFAGQSSGKGTCECIAFNSGKGAVYDAEVLHGTAKVVEQAYGSAPSRCHHHVLDLEAAAVVVALEALHARGQRREHLFFHVDVGHLLDVYLAVAGGVDVIVNRQQVVHVGYLERSVLRAGSIQRQYLVGQDGHREVQSVEAVDVVSHKLDGHLVAGTHHHADVRLLAIDRAEENGVAFLVGQLGCPRIIAVIDHHVVARRAVAAHRLGRDGTAQQNEMLARSTQRQLALIVVAVGRAVTSLVVNLVIYGIRIERHDAALAVFVVLRRHLQAPYGIERHGLLGRQLAVGGIEVALAVRLCVPAYKLVVQAALALGIRSQLEGRHEEAVVGLEHLVVGAGDAVMVGVERQPCAVRHIVGVGEHGLIVERMEEY